MKTKREVAPSKRIKSQHRKKHTEMMVVGLDLDGKQICERVTTGLSLREFAMEPKNQIGVGALWLAFKRKQGKNRGTGQVLPRTGSRWHICHPDKRN